MEMKKYKLLDDDTITLSNGTVLYRIQNLRTNKKGGYIASEKNLSQRGRAWVADKAQVFDNAKVCENAWVGGNALVYGNAEVGSHAKVYGNAHVYGNARVYSHAKVYGDTLVFGDAWISGNAQVYDNASVFGNIDVSENAKIFGDALIFGSFDVRTDISTRFPTIVIDSPEKVAKLKEFWTSLMQ